MVGERKLLIQDRSVDFFVVKRIIRWNTDYKLIKKSSKAIIIEQVVMT